MLDRSGQSSSRRVKALVMPRELPRPVEPSRLDARKMESADGAVTASMLIFDLEAVATVQEAQPCPRNLELRRSLQILASSQTHFEARLLRDLRVYKQRLLKEEGFLDIVILATCLAAVGYRVSVRTALGGGSGQECFNNLRYEFLLVSEELGAVEYVVDPRFREQFQIPHSTPHYDALLEFAPEEYVGSSGRLKPVVKLLCGQMQEAFEAVGLTCPPWRRSQSMISKWVPAKVRDVEVASPSSSPEARYGKGLVGMSPRGPLSRCNSGATTSSTASSTRTTASRRATPVPAAVAKPMVRQAGFELCAPAVYAVGEARDPAPTGCGDRPKPGSGKAHGCKENITAAPGLSRAGSLQAKLSATAAQLPRAEWQAPRIRTVKMGGARAR